MIPSMRRRESVSWPEALVGLAAGILLSRALPTILRRLGILGPSSLVDDSDVGSEVSSEDLPHTGGSQLGAHKLVLCVRTDLRMTKGKVAAQVGHAVLGAYKRAGRINVAALKHWEYNAQPKIAVQIRSFGEAQELEQEAKRHGLSTYMVYDAGRTQVASGSMTVLAIGPGPSSTIDKVTGRLRLL